MNQRLLAYGLMCGTCLSSAILAKAAEADVVPPERYQLDARKVDRATGQTTWLSADLQIGPSGPSGLTLISQHGAVQTLTLNSGTNWESMAIYVSGTTVTVGVGTTSVNFTQSGSTYNSTEANGATLTKSGSIYTYIDDAGAKILYDETKGNGSTIGLTARATSVTFPKGEVDTLYWKSLTYCGGIIQNSVPVGGPKPSDPGSVTSSTGPVSNAIAAAQTCQTLRRLQSVGSSQGYQLHYLYNNDSAPASDADATAWLTLYAVSSANTASSYCDPLGASCASVVATANYSSSTNGSVRTQSVTDPLGRTTIFTYQPGQFAVRTALSSVNDIIYTIDSNYVISKVQWRGLTYNYSTSLAGNIRQVDSFSPTNDKETTKVDTTIAQITSYTDGAGRTWTYTYNLGNLSDVQDPLGDKAHYDRDARGNVVTTTFIPASSTATQYSTSASYLAGCTNRITCNLPQSFTDGKGQTTSYTYDPVHGGVVTVTGPQVNGVAPQVRNTYTQLQANIRNSAGNLVASGVPVYRLTASSTCRTSASCAGTADEVKTTISYAQNNLLASSVTAGAGNGDTTQTSTSATTYTDAGDVLSVDGPLAGSVDTIRYRYDADHEVTGIIAPDPDGAGGKQNPAVRVSFNADGNVILTEQGVVPSQADGDWGSFAVHRQIATAYDGNGRKTQDSSQASGTTYAVVQYNYDANGRLNCTAMRMNPVIFGSLPDACTLGTRGTPGTPGDYGPDRITRTEYDSANEVVKATSGLGVSNRVNSFTYNPNGALATVTDGNGNLSNRVYDGLGRVYQIQYPSPTKGAGAANGSDFEQFGYDNNGNVTSRIIRNGVNGTTINYGYDALNRLISKTLPTGTFNASATFSYDLLGHVLTAHNVYPGHQTGTSFSYDALGRTLTETSSFDTANARTMDMQYDAAGRRARLTWWDGLYVTYDYDNDDQMTAIRENGATVLAGFSYDDDGRRASRTFANGTSASYGYDAMSRLTSLGLNGGTNATAVTLNNYNPAGQIGNRTNSNDAYAWNGAVNVNRSYTANGLNQYSNVAGQTQGYDVKGNLTSSGGTTFSYGAENTISTVNGGGIFHDALRRMVFVSIAPSVRFSYVDDQLTNELDGSGAIVKRYVFGPGTDEPLVWYEGSGTGTKRYLDSDERGSVTRVTDQSGNTVVVDSYDEYGIPGTANQGRFQYTGQAWIPQLGLSYYKNRLYSTTMGRFMQPDPIRDADGPNIYNYTHGDPINASDPSGLQAHETVDQGTTLPRDKDAEPQPDIIVEGRRGSPSGHIDPGAGVPAGVIGSGGGATKTGTRTDATQDEVVVSCDAACRLRILGHTAAALAGRAIALPATLVMMVVDAFNDPLCCFTAGTQVSTPIGLQAIETLKVGDLVISRSDNTGETVSKPIVSITPAHERRIWTVNVSYKDTDGRWKNERYETTEDHPWRTADGHWIPSASLERGQVLAREDGTAVVVAVADIGKTKLTYNLEIAGFHTYFVGDAKLWVHNACFKMRVPGLSGKEAAKNVPSWARGLKPFVDESGRDFATRILDGRYGAGNYATGPTSDFNILKKYADRGFE